MSTSNEPPVKVQVLYLVRRKKWETKDVSVSGFDGKCQIKVESTARKILRQKTMEIEVSGNNFCVVEMGTAGCHSNVIGLLCMKRDSKIQGHFFKSQHKEILNNLMTILRECCRVDSFDVNLDEDLNCFPSQSTKAQLHVFHDKICLSSNSGYDFKILCEYPLNSLSNWQQDPTNVTLTIVHKGKEEKLLLKTDKGRGICAKLSSSVQEGYQGVQQCDGNSNIITIPSRISKSCEILDHLHRRTRPKANSMLSSKRKPKPKSQLTPELSMETKDFKQNYPDPCFAGTGPFESNVTVESKVKLTALEICDETNGQNSCSSPSDVHDSVTLQPSPPPIPQRQAKQNSAKGGESLPRAYTLPPSFRIVSQLDVGERQHLKSEISSKGIKTVEIKELVQPIRVDPLYRNFGNHCDSYTGLKINVETNKTSESCGVCSREGEEQDIFSMAGSERGSEPCVEEPTVMQNRASPQPFMMSDSVPNSHADRKIQDEDKEQSSDSTCHYVNLPEGSRPSCYLYMNLPNLKTVPKEAAVYVNHVFMSHSMQGIYENVQQFYNEKLEECGAPPVPPPVLKPRQPPPRLPKRACGGGQRVQPTPPRSPPHMGAPHSPPPPRPPKKHGGVSKMLERGIQRQQDIQVTIAVFASKAVAGREWFLRIVVMQHDPDDSTFKMVMDRELASNYRLMQTHPFSISSDIVISLKHQCKQFKLTSENAQEVGYNIIKDLLHGFWFVIEFHLEHLSSDGEHFVGNVCVEPKDLLPGEKCPVNKRVNLGINEDFELKVHPQRVNCKQHGILRGQENQTSKHVISDYAKRKKMCGLLDISSYKQNWRDVAGKLRFSWEEIKGIEDKAHRCPTFSPMEDVLTTWEQRDPESSLERLIRVLRDIERFDVISDLGFPVGSEIL